MTQRRVTHAQWLDEGKALFGDDQMTWRFVCPSCGHVASIQDWKDAGAEQGEVAFSCVGRHAANAGLAAEAAFRKNGGPCNYTGGGLFKLNPVAVDFGSGGAPRMTFEFAPLVVASEASVVQGETG